MRKPLHAYFSMLLFLLPAGAALAQGGLVTPERPAEFMIYQYPDTVLVVNVDLPEAGFSMRTIGPDGALLRASEVPGRRLGPVFQYLDAADLPRQLKIEVTPERPVDRSTIRMQLLQLRADDPNAKRLAQAYRQYSLGAEAAHGNDSNTWVVKTYSLRNAAESFAAMGMEEMRLWSEYFAAHLVLHRLEDRLTAIELAGEVRAGAARAGFGEVELAALVLESDALMGLLGQDADPAVRSRFTGQATAVLQRLAELAGERGMSSEQGRAVYRQGLLAEREEDHDLALERYALAQQIVEPTVDIDLLNQVRGAAASLYERLGRTSGAIAMLDRVTGDLSAEQQAEATADLARGLFDKGRLLNLDYRYSEALAPLGEALALRQAGAGGEPWGPVALELAWSYHSLGYGEEAARLIDEGIPRTPIEGNRAALARAWGVLADYHRGRGAPGEARQARSRQLDRVGDGPGRASALLESALDAWRQGQPALAEAEARLRESRQAAALEGDEVTRQLATLQLCALAADHGRGAACSLAETGTLAEGPALAAVPRAAAEARLIQAGLLAAAGQRETAWAALDRLVEDLHWMRRAIPGVFGAWYFERRAALARDYLGLASEGGHGARGVLLAIERLGRLEDTDYLLAGAAPLKVDQSDALREALAAAETARGTAVREAGPRVGRLLAGARDACSDCRAEAGSLPGQQDLERWLAALGPSETVLAYDFSGARVRALVADRAGIRQVALPGTEGLVDRLRRLQAGSGVTASLDDLDEVGRLLLGPLAETLPERIYLLSAGPLRGLPFDALRRQGRFLGSDHSVVNLQSLSALPRRGESMPADFRSRVFLAGNPRTDNDPFSFEVVVSPEIATLTETFVGPGLHVIQGVALQLDEFSDPRFMGADLVHLAAPGRIDLGRPERSRIRLSDGTGDAGSGGLAPAQIRGFRVSAGLVVLSGTSLSGPGQAPADVRMPLVSDFLAAGARRVLAALWPLDGAATGAFMDAYYQRLAASPDAAEALAQTKRARIAESDPENFETWAGFQLFIR